jgi:hypothetical protein
MFKEQLSREDMYSAESLDGVFDKYRQTREEEGAKGNVLKISWHLVLCP